MKNCKFFSILMMLNILILSGCEQEEDLGTDGGDQPWERQFLFGHFKINGESILTHEESTMDDHILDDVCYASLPSGPLQTFSINVYVPTHANPDYQAGGQAVGMTVFYGGTKTPKINNTFTFIRKETINGIEYSKFLVGGQYNGSDLTRDNFQQFRYDFDMVYLDGNKEEIRRDLKAVTINIKDCGSTGGSAGGSGGGTGGSGSGSGGSGGSGSSTGSLVVWADEDHGCGHLKVYVENSYKGTVTGYYSSGTPGCGDSHCVTVNNLSPGTYSVYAECEDESGYWPSDDITVYAGECSTYLLD